MQIIYYYAKFVKVDIIYLKILCFAMNVIIVGKIKFNINFFS